MAIRPTVVTAKDASRNPNVKEDDYFAKIITYIPAEIVAAYVSLRGFVITPEEAIEAPDKPDYYAVIFFGILVLTPIYTFFATREQNKPKPIFHTIVATIAFAFWIFALGVYFTRFDFHDFILASIFLVFITLVIPLAERIFLKPTKI